MKKRIIILLILIATVFSLNALSFSSFVTDLSYDERFSNGFFPLSGKYKYIADLPEFFDEINSSISLNFNSGLKHRLLMQNPDSGEHLDRNDKSLNRLYGVEFIYFDLSYRLGLINAEYLTEPILALSVAFEGNFENARERLGFMRDDEEKSAFAPYKDFSAIRELNIDSKTNARTLSHTGLKLSLDYYYLEEKRMTDDGLWASVTLKYLPSFFPLHDKNGSSYLSLDLNGGVAYTLLNISQFSLSYSEEALTMFSLGVKSELNFRALMGEGIPQYALEREKSLYHAPNTLYQVANKTTLTFKGPQIKEDIYPIISLLSDIAYSFGNVANGEGSLSHFDGSISLQGELNLFDTLYVYVLASYVYSSYYQPDEGFTYSLGLRLGL